MNVTYEQLAALIADMDDDQKKMPVVVSVIGSWYEICAMTQLTFVKPAEEGDTQYEIGQPILEGVD